MAIGFQPVGAALPPRRDSIVTAAAAPVPSGNDWGNSINVPLARDRMIETFEREQLPSEVKSTLAAALAGDLHYQALLFSAMLDTWPKLQKAIDEIARLTAVAPWKVVPFARRGDKPDAKAEALAKDVEALIWGMKPRPARMEAGLEETMRALVRGYYYGHEVSEIRWEKQDGGWKPRATKSVPARFYGYPYDVAEDPEDRLMFDPNGMNGARAFEDFPDHRFLIAIHAGHGGHPANAAPLRALAAYWLAAVYGLKWFMNFTQLYGIPWRHAEVADSKDTNAVKNALSLIGSNGYLVTNPGTKINILSPGSTSGASLPQRELIALADEQCDKFILGQTLTSGTDGSGSRALGEVHQGTLDGVVDGVTDFVGGILTHQLIPAIVALNFGGRTDLPEFWAKREEAKDEKGNAERMEIVTRIGVPMSEAYVYENLGIPIPAAGDKLFESAKPEPPPADPNAPPGMPPIQGKAMAKAWMPAKPNPADKSQVKAADANGWKMFDGKSGTLGIPRREMPQIASGNRAAMVSFLKARGIESKRETVKASSLKPTQAEYSPSKVQAAKDYQGGNRAILISEDNHVVDGHHQWMSADGREIEVIRLMAPIARVLMMAHRMPSTTVAAASAAALIIEAGGFRTLEDGRVIYIERTRSDSPGDASAGQYRKLGNSPKETSDKKADREKQRQPVPEPSAEDLRNPKAKPDDDDPDETSDLEKARKEYEAEQLEESMTGFPEIGKEMKGQLPRPEDLPEDDPLRGDVQMIWDRFKKETRNEDSDGRAVIAPSGAAQYFAPKGTRANLDDLRQQMNEQGFNFENPSDMLQAIYESLEGRKSWGTKSTGDTYDVAAADASQVARLEALMKQAEEAINSDGIVDEDAVASMLSAAWVSGAKES